MDTPSVLGYQVVEFGLFSGCESDVILAVEQLGHPPTPFRRQKRYLFVRQVKRGRGLDVEQFVQTNAENRSCRSGDLQVRPLDRIGVRESVQRLGVDAHAEPLLDLP